MKANIFITIGTISFLAFVICLFGSKTLVHEIKAYLLLITSALFLGFGSVIQAIEKNK